MYCPRNLANAEEVEDRHCQADGCTAPVTIGSDNPDVMSSTDWCADHVHVVGKRSLLGALQSTPYCLARGCCGERVRTILAVDGDRVGTHWCTDHVRARDPQWCAWYRAQARRASGTVDPIPCVAVILFAAVNIALFAAFCVIGRADIPGQMLWNA
jgi:hypothetical protein